MSEELEVLKRVTQRLADYEIHYMVTGSIAMNFYAVPRMTRDIDIVVELGEAEVNRITDAFQEDFYIEREALEQAVKFQGMCNLIDISSLIKVDFIIRKDTEYRREEFARRQSVLIEGQEVFFVAPEDLILSKLDWAKESRSEIQLKDVRNIIDAVPNLDQDYLASWAGRLELEELYREVNR